MNENAERLYGKLRRTLPLPHTERQSDLQALLEVKDSFCLYSVERNGASTLLRDFAARKGALYLDAMEGGINTPADLDTCVGESPFILDETSTFFRRSGYQEALRTLAKYAQTRQVGVRLHVDKDEAIVSDLSGHGFATVHMGKMPYAEWNPSL